MVDDNKLKDEVLAQIVQMLEVEGTFTEIAYAIIEKAEGYLQTTNAAILQVSEDKKTLGTIIEYNRMGSAPIKLVSVQYEGNGLYSDGVTAYTLDTEDEQISKQLDELGVKTVITAPILINDMKAMYFTVFDRINCIDCNDELLQFVNGVAKIIQSIAQKKVTKNSLLSSYGVLREILSSIGLGIIVCNAHDGTIFFENEIAQNSDEVRRTIKECIQQYFEEKRYEDAAKRRTPIEYYDTDSGLWFEIKFSDLTWIDGSKVFICTAMDITQKKKNQQRIEYQAHNDFLTGLYNRMKCEQDLRDIIAQTEADGTSGAVMFIDLDNFKNINDGLGHQYGDILLQQIAAGLQTIPGLNGKCYRMGGDEFVIIIQPELFNQLDRIVKNVILMFNKPWYLVETEYYCTMSMGIAVFPKDSTDVNEIVKLADIAMYESKKSGKNRYCYYDKSKANNTGKRLDIENNMRQAIASEIKEFVVFYQPVIDVTTNEFVSCEALVRWNSKALGFMGPGEFIPLAEYLGLITSIGDYVLEEACKQCKKWNENGYPDFRVNVNLSVVQLLQKDVVSNIERILKKTGVKASNIVLEITESFAINDMERVLDIINGIRKLGPKIALDDFGTGYSSLNYIKKLPLDLIKVDKTFIDDVVEDEYAQAFIKLIVDLSTTIGTKIVVEGIEEVEQFELLKSLGVNYIQGYLFGKPVPADEFEKINLNKQKQD